MATLAYHGGTEQVSIGDRFAWWDGRTWEVAAFTDGRSYSPSGLGGTPTVLCRQIAGERDNHAHQWADADGLVEWCGDSVAAGLARGRIAGDNL
jgi:hypothetical protein